MRPDYRRDTVCPRGHDLTLPGGVYEDASTGKRQCTVCRQWRDREYKRRKAAMLRQQSAAAVAAPPPREPTTDNTQGVALSIRCAGGTDQPARDGAHSFFLAMTKINSLRVIVCGGRNYCDQATVDEVLDSLWLETPGILTILHGCAAGADACANAWVFGKRAKGFQVNVERYEADWRKHGRAAGPIRNSHMAAHGKANLLIAFPGGSGTRDMVAKAQAAGIPVRQIGVTPPASCA